jgi:hypothetical protein
MVVGNYSTIKVDKHYLYYMLCTEPYPDCTRPQVFQWGLEESSTSVTTMVTQTTGTTSFLEGFTFPSTTGTTTSTTKFEPTTTEKASNSIVDSAEQVGNSTVIYWVSGVGGILLIAILAVYSISRRNRQVGIENGIPMVDMSGRRMIQVGTENGTSTVETSSSGILQDRNQNGTSMVDTSSSGILQDITDKGIPIADMPSSDCLHKII